MRLATLNGSFNPKIECCSFPSRPFTSSIFAQWKIPRIMIPSLIPLCKVPQRTGYEYQEFGKSLGAKDEKQGICERSAIEIPCDSFCSKYAKSVKNSWIIGVTQFVTEFKYSLEARELFISERGMVCEGIWGARFGIEPARVSLCTNIRSPSVGSWFSQTHLSFHDPRSISTNLKFQKKIISVGFP